MNKEQIVEAIMVMRDEYAHSAGEDLKKIGRKALSNPLAPIIPPLERGYYETQAKIYVLGELLEKIANAPDDTQGIITARDDVSGELLAQEILSWTKRTYGEVIDECGERITSRYTALADDIERLCEKYLKKGV